MNDVVTIQSDTPGLAARVKLAVLIGKESAGKSQLAASLTGNSASAQNFRGSTVAVERYRGDGIEYLDTPGILRLSDAETTRLALAELAGAESVLLVARATHLDEDLAELLPLVEGKLGAVAVTWWDKVAPGEHAFEALEKLSNEAGVPFIAVDGRRLVLQQSRRIEDTLAKPATFQKAKLTARAGWRIEPKSGPLEHRLLGPLLATLMLIAPAAAAVAFANEIAGRLDPIVDDWTRPIATTVDVYLPLWLQVPLTARYGLLDMGPFLVVWALPTVLIYSVLIGAYKTSGLIDRITAAMHPQARPFGLTGRDVTRVVMGFGCNVPAVVSTRGCSRCSRGPAISAIAFGAACSYQLPATLAVFSASGRPWLVWPYLGYLLATTLAYLRLTSSAQSRSPLNRLVFHGRTFLTWPRPDALWREARSVLSQFLFQVLPVFAVVCISTAVLNSAGMTDTASGLLRPAMAAFRLPPDAAVPVAMASVRKDGIVLFAESKTLEMLSASQVLTGVYLAGVLTPCLVTALTIVRETSPLYAAKLLLRQVAFAIGFSLALAWCSLAVGL